MKRNLFKIHGYIFGNTDFIQDRLFNFIQENKKKYGIQKHTDYSVVFCIPY